MSTPGRQEAVKSRPPPFCMHTSTHRKSLPPSSPLSLSHLCTSYIILLPGKRTDILEGKTGRLKKHSKAALRDDLHEVLAPCLACPLALLPSPTPYFPEFFLRLGNSSRVWILAFPPCLPHGLVLDCASTHGVKRKSKTWPFAMIRHFGRHLPLAYVGLEAANPALPMPPSGSFGRTENILPAAEACISMCVFFTPPLCSFHQNKPQHIRLVSPDGVGGH